MTPEKHIFLINDIACRRGGRALFQNVSFTVESGAAVHLCGRNGVGKTSLLRILAGALPRAGGDISWRGEDFLKDGAAAHATRFSYMPADDGYLKAQETVDETLLFWIKLWNVKPERRGLALAAVGLERLAARPVRVLSAGQRRRLSLARLVLRAPQETPLWLADEPLAGLDAAGVALFFKALAGHLAAGGMAVIASHLPIPAAQEFHVQPVSGGGAC